MYAASQMRVTSVSKPVGRSKSVAGSSFIVVRNTSAAPATSPGATSGSVTRRNAALVFLTTMKELPATLLLRPTGFDTLVTRIWDAASAGYYGYAAIPALLLLVVSGLSMVVILRQE